MIEQRSTPTPRAIHLPEIVRKDSSRAVRPDFPAIVRLQKLIFEEAAATGASDVHIEPRAAGTRVRYRINGLMKDAFDLPRWLHDNLVARIKVMSHLDISEKRVPQDGHIGVDDSSGSEIRVSILPSRAGEKVVLRLLRNNKEFRALAELSLPADVEETLRALMHRPQGIIAVVGPTGSGKTTTLYALVHEVCREPLNIVTIEDPVEFEIERITQVQVHEKAGLTFARALRAILRQDPDVILVGEIRDAETAKTAFDAAMTGHLVLTTVHSTDCVSAVARLVELGVPREMIASGTAAVIAQRLVRENCPVCITDDAPRPIYARRLGISEEDYGQLKRGEGCPSCDFTGIKGRVGLYEVMEFSRQYRDVVLNGSEGEMRCALKSAGVRTLTEQAVERVHRGSISVAEAYRTCYFGGGVHE